MLTATEATLPLYCVGIMANPCRPFEIGVLAWNLVLHEAALHPTDPDPIVVPAILDGWIWQEYYSIHVLDLSTLSIGKFVWSFDILFPSNFRS